MSKRARLLLILFFVAVGGFFLYPTIQWYFFTPESVKTQTAMPRMKIRNDMRDLAVAEYNTLFKKVKADLSQNISAEHQDIIQTAERIARITGYTIPDQWSLEQLKSSDLVTMVEGTPPVDEVDSSIEAEQPDENQSEADGSGDVSGEGETADGTVSLSEVTDLLSSAGNSYFEFNELVAEYKAMLDRFNSQIGGPVPEEYEYLKKAAAEMYERTGRRVPEKWSIYNMFLAWQDKNGPIGVIHDRYTKRVFDQKDLYSRTIKLGLDLQGGLSAVISADAESLRERNSIREQEGLTPMTMEEAINQAMLILNNRVDNFGVVEPEIRQQGTDNILIELPGEASRSRIDDILTGKGSLGFHIVNEQLSGEVFDREGNLVAPDKVDQSKFMIGYEYEMDSFGFIDDTKDPTPMVLHRAAPETGSGDDENRDYVFLDGSHIIDAEISRGGSTGTETVVSFSLDDKGTRIFSNMTKKYSAENNRSRLAIVMDGKVKAAPSITQHIAGGRGQITGFNRDEAYTISNILKTGSMPIDLVLEEFNEVGPSLGADTIEDGLWAITIGFILVIVFMALYYRGAGLVADVALILNLFFMISILSAFRFTLTLTSIAGLILTVGMAVDANVIIFERIKDELRLGKSRAGAVKTGFEKAMWTILDANITTFIAAICLAQIKSGPVAGFAVTLAVGIVSSMFTALVVSRLIFDFFTDTFKSQKVSISWRKLNG